MKNQMICTVMLITLTACASARSNSYYTLSPSIPAPQASPAKPVAENWTLAPLTIPEVLNRPQIIRKSGANKIDILEYDRWAEPMDSMIYRTLADDLTARMGMSAGSASQTTEQRIAVAIDEFDADADGNVFLTATWTVQKDETTTSHIFQHSEKSSANDFASIAAAMSRLLGNLADAIAGG